MSNSYHPEKYWSEVSELIKQRNDDNVIAGDDEPYYRYKRNRFLEMLSTIDFNNKNVLEVGCGPGGNLIEVLKKNPKNLQAVDISENMVKLATKNTLGKVAIHKINGTKFPFDDKTFDIIFTATVLQHNTDEQMLTQLIAEICRVSTNRVCIFERVDSKIKGDELCLGRPVSYYENIFKSNNFELVEKEFINIRVSYLICGAIRKIFNSSNRTEGQPITKFSVFLQNVTLPIYKVLDKIFKSKSDLTKLVFVRTN